MSDYQWSVPLVSAPAVRLVEFETITGVAAMANPARVNYIMKSGPDVTEIVFHDNASLYVKGVMADVCAKLQGA